ncbi:MAG: ornithine cyclodeaminase [Osedax symbiont Rs2]|nr:MAG: ornithine cyclodeaminase [Osedax symbiont Rs2]
MKFISEQVSARLISHELAFEAVSAAFIEAVQTATTFPVVNAHGSDSQNRFSIKSAANSTVAGLKIGSYWPGNTQQGLPCHSSVILLIDQHSGQLAAVIEASKVNAYRTAAADAVAADLLARKDAKVLTIFGTGHQAAYECRAIAKIRDLDRVYVVGRNPERAAAFAQALIVDGIDASVASAQQACEAADIIVTATTATAPLFKAQWVQPGTHVASMGSDSEGKQELPEQLLASAELFCDLSSQSMRIGELQHIKHLLTPGTKQLTMIGEVLLNTAAGRTSKSQITVFDSSGISLQDLSIGGYLLQRADAEQSLVWL